MTDWTNMTLDGSLDDLIGEVDRQAGEVLLDSLQADARKIRLLKAAAHLRFALAELMHVEDVLLWAKCGAHHDTTKTGEVFNRCRKQRGHDGEHNDGDRLRWTT